MTTKRVPNRSDLGLKPLAPKRITHTRPRNDGYLADVGARVGELADWRGYTKMQLGGRSGLHVNAVAKIINGEADMRLTSLIALAEALEVPICELLP